MARHIHIHLQDVLESGPSKGAFQRNIKTEIATGKPTKQAVAIAYAKQREARDQSSCSCAGRSKTQSEGT